MKLIKFIKNYGVPIIYFIFLAMFFVVAWFSFVAFV